MNLPTLDWHLNCSWMSEFLTFGDLNRLSLTSKEMGSFAMAEDVIELLGSKYNVMEEDVPATLMAMAKSLQDK